MKKIFTVVLFILLAVTSFAQSKNCVIHAVPIGIVGSQMNTDEWPDTYLTVNKEWIITYEGIWIMLSEDGRTVTISEDRPEFIDASYILPSKEFIAYEEAMWNLPGEDQTKKFKYDYKNYGNLRYLVITVKLKEE